MANFTSTSRRKKTSSSSKQQQGRQKEGQQPPLRQRAQAVLKKAHEYATVPSVGRLPRLNDTAKKHPMAAAVVAAGVTTGLTLLIVRAMGATIDAFVQGLPSSRGSDGDEQSYETLTESARAQDEQHHQDRLHRRRPWGA